jgi:predicted ribosomally synthesized peptide with nif11-like leader
MSVENLKKYGQLCAEDKKIRAKAKEIGIQDIDGQIAYGKSLGLEFSKEDFEALAKEAEINGKEELSEKELQKVAGGIVTTTAICLGAVVVMGGASIAAATDAPSW